MVLDKEPFEVQVNIAKAAVDSAEADLVAARRTGRASRGRCAACDSLWIGLSRMCTTRSSCCSRRRPPCDLSKATLAKAQADYNRAIPLVKTGAMSKEEHDVRNAALLIARAQVEEALQGVYQVRVALGLPTPKRGSSAAITSRKSPAGSGSNLFLGPAGAIRLIQAASQIGVIEFIQQAAKTNGGQTSINAIPRGISISFTKAPEGCPGRQTGPDQTCRGESQSRSGQVESALLRRGVGN